MMYKKYIQNIVLRHT